MKNFICGEENLPFAGGQQKGDTEGEKLKKKIFSGMFDNLGEGGGLDAQKHGEMRDFSPKLFPLRTRSLHSSTAITKKTPPHTDCVSRVMCSRWGRDINQK